MPVAGMAASDQPWNRIILPPRAAKRERSGSVALKAADVFAFSGSKSRSKLKSAGVQPWGAPTMYLTKLPPNAFWTLAPGAGPKIQRSHPADPGAVSPPGGKPK